VVADIGKPSDVARLIVEVLERHGRLNILVNNAGIAPLTPVGDATPEEYDQVFLANVRALVDVTPQALPSIKASKGNIVNLTFTIIACGGQHVDLCRQQRGGHVLYPGLGQGAGRARRAGERVSPGPIETSIYDKTALSEDDSKAHRDRVTDMVPLNRFGTPRKWRR
jgi:NAD(P)-dependent dehydrogenase (short-subunit alcohol dehydrogenase family)